MSHNYDYRKRNPWVTKENKHPQNSPKESQVGTKNRFIENINNCIKQGKENISENPKTTLQDINTLALFVSEINFAQMK